MRTSRKFFSSKYVDVTHVGISFNTLAKAGSIAAYNSVAGAAEWTLRESNKIVPLDKGPLQASGRVKSEVSGGAVGAAFGTGASTSFGGKQEGVVSAPVVYGNSSVNYARVQHEAHFAHRNNRRRRYLYEALMRCKEQRILQMKMKDRWNAIASAL